MQILKSTIHIQGAKQTYRKTKRTKEQIQSLSLKNFFVKPSLCRGEAPRLNAFYSIFHEQMAVLLPVNHNL